MVFVVSARTALFPLVLLSVVRHFAEGHTWIDCIDTDRSKLYDQSASYIFGGAGGNGFCAGYGAGYPGRGDASIGTGYTYKLLKNEVEAGAPVCKNVGANAYTDWRKRLKVAPGQTAYYAYLPNGHIVKDKKAVGTQHGIYWTGQVGTSLASTHDMTPEHLLMGHTLDFDDGNCGETTDTKGVPSNRAGDGKPCVGSFAVPVGTAPGIYSMVWYWKFWLDNPDAYKDKEMAKGYFGAAYSTCFEVEVTPGGSTTPQAAPPVKALVPPAAPKVGKPLVAAEADPPIVLVTNEQVAAEADPPAVLVTNEQVAAEADPLSPPIVADSAPIDTLALPGAVTPAPMDPVLGAVTPAPTAPGPEPVTPSAMDPGPGEVMPAPGAQIPVEMPATPMVTPAATSPSSELPPAPASVSSGTVCRRRMRS